MQAVLVNVDMLSLWWMELDYTACIVEEQCLDVGHLAPRRTPVLRANTDMIPAHTVSDYDSHESACRGSPNKEHPKPITTSTGEPAFHDTVVLDERRVLLA